MNLLLLNSYLEHKMHYLDCNMILTFLDLTLQTFCNGLLPLQHFKLDNKHFLYYNGYQNYFHQLLEQVNNILLIDLSSQDYNKCLQAPIMLTIL